MNDLPQISKAYTNHPDFRNIVLDISKAAYLES